MSYAVSNTNPTSQPQGSTFFFRAPLPSTILCRIVSKLSFPSFNPSFFLQIAPCKVSSQLPKAQESKSEEIIPGSFPWSSVHSAGLQILYTIYLYPRGMLGSGRSIRQPGLSSDLWLLSEVQELPLDHFSYLYIVISPHLRPVIVPKTHPWATWVLTVAVAAVRLEYGSILIGIIV